jgi:hypothetical protein
MNSTTLIAIGALAFLMMGGKKKPRVVHGTVTPIDDELMEIRPGKPPTRPASLEDELAEQDAPPPASSSTSTSSPPAASVAPRPAATVPGNTTDELFAASAAQAAQMPPAAVQVAPTQKEATPFRPPPPLPTVPAAAPARPMGPMVDVEVPINRVNATTNNVSPVLQPKSQGPQIPAGYDPAKAKAGASAIASHLAKKGPSGYSHPQLAIWQKQAALAPDGIYGGSTRGALIAFGVKDPPRPFFKPVATIPYVPPEQRT